MSKSKPDRATEQQYELESQFILRLPPEPAKVLRDVLRTGTSLKDRLFIALENDIRRGQVVDLPCIIESLKTIDLKSAYKTADICQMLICKEEDPLPSDDEEKNKPKKKDPLKVDKKYLWPHGITPPMKNVRKRRFRKTLRKKYVEAPEIEKEIKRLLRGDSEAVNVKWEVINEETEKPNLKTKGQTIKVEPLAQGVAHNILNEDSQSVDVAEHDIFGEALSDSDDDEANHNLLGLEDENSRLSCEDGSRFSDSISHQGASGSRDLVTEFRREMFTDEDDFVVQMPQVKNEIYYEQPTCVSAVDEFSVKDEYTYDLNIKTTDECRYGSEFISTENSEFGNIRAKMNSLQAELTELKARRHQQELEIASIENSALKQRFQSILDNLVAEQAEKEQEYLELASIMEGS